ncbi:MAG: ribosomal protein L11 methyltransferase, partial [Rhodobacterales bacterium 17-64-5]
MPTYSALTTLPGEAAAQSLASAMERMAPEPTGVGVFEIEDGSGLWEVGGYFLEPPDDIILEVLATAFGAKPFALSELPDIDWVAKVRRELAPVEAGRFFVYGSHDADKVPQDPDRVPLQIEATVAFGTGHHGTTLGCLLAFDRLLTAGMRPATVADIG